jgi:hypothetical protein
MPSSPTSENVYTENTDTVRSYRLTGWQLSGEKVAVRTNSEEAGRSGASNFEAFSRNKAACSILEFRFTSHARLRHELGSYLSRTVLSIQHSQTVDRLHTIR